jgi:hypothetical protein
VAVQVAKNISVELAVVLPSAVVYAPDTTLITVDWRFVRQWSLATTVGDGGTTIFDVVWRHRY